MKKTTRDTIIGILVILIIGVLLLLLYRYTTQRDNRELTKRIAELSPRGGPPETIDGLREAIALYSAQIERNVKEGAQTGVYWKILAIRLADKKMYRDALDAIERALQYNADDPTLFYLTGEYASVVAASTLSFNSGSIEEKKQYTELAESAYLRSIQLDPSYSKPRLGIGVLYAFDLGRPGDAIPHLERFLQISPNSIEGMFVMARAYYMNENYDNAIEIYDRIISKSKNQTVKAEAQNNKNLIRDLMYE
jgi:tetratricopeptide (TPR) repeat protein